MRVGEEEEGWKIIFVITISLLTLLLPQCLNTENEAHFFRVHALECSTLKGMCFIIYVLVLS